MATVMIRVDETARDAAAALATAKGTTIAEVVEQAIAEARRAAFWEQQNAALDRLSATDLGDYHAERESMSPSLMDGSDQW